MDEADSKAAASQKLAHFSDKKDLVKALDTTNAELLYIGTSSLCSFFRPLFFACMEQPLQTRVSWSGS